MEHLCQITSYYGSLLLVDWLMQDNMQNLYLLVLGTVFADFKPLGIHGDNLFL